MLLLTSTTMTMAMPSVLMRVFRSGQRGPAAATTRHSKASRRRAVPPQKAMRERPAGSPLSRDATGWRTLPRRCHSHQHKSGGRSSASNRSRGWLKWKSDIRGRIVSVVCLAAQSKCWSNHCADSDVGQNSLRQRAADVTAGQRLTTAGHPLASGNGQFLARALDPSPAEDTLAVVEHHCLARRDGALRLGELDAGAAIRKDRHQRVGSRVAVADPGAAGQRSRGRVAKPVDRRGNQLGGEQLLARADHDVMRRGEDLQDVAALACCEAEALALAYGEALDAVVVGEHLPRCIDDATRRCGVGASVADESGMVAVRDKTDLDTIRLVMDAQSRLARQGPHLLLVKVPDGKQQSRQ